jgi:hypothetical protein
MREEVQRYLDGDLARASLSAEAEAELREWEALAGSAIVARRLDRAPASLVADVMGALPEPRTSPVQHVVSWLITPRPVRIAPLGPLALAAAAVVLMIMIPNPRPQSAAPVSVAGSGTVTEVAAVEAPTVYVQFALTARGAQTVAVAGDFNNWSMDAGTLRDPDGDGVWVGMMPVTPGVHKYMFVVDGTEWVTDPRADGYADDGFGMRNAVVSVGPPLERTT